MPTTEYVSLLSPSPPRPARVTAPQGQENTEPVTINLLSPEPVAAACDIVKIPEKPPVFLDLSNQQLPTRQRAPSVRKATRCKGAPYPTAYPDLPVSSVQ